MEVNLDKRYPLDVDPARAWLVLRDVPRVAACMPGASITEQIDATHYKGAVKVKVGPATAAFGGDIEVRQLDEATHTVQLFGKGADRSGSSASMDLTAQVEPGETPGSATLVGNAAVIVNGKFAQFGGRMMVQVADMLLAQFADNFRAEAAALPLPEGTAETSPAVLAVAADASAPATVAQAQARDASASVAGLVANAQAAAADVVAGAGNALQGAADLAHTASASVAASLATATRTVQAAPAVAARRNHEINALALVWGLIKAWVTGLFGRKT